jgi:hypothetical protein
MMMNFVEVLGQNITMGKRMDPWQQQWSQLGFKLSGIPMGGRDAK